MTTNIDIHGEEMQERQKNFLAFLEHKLDVEKSAKQVDIADSIGIRDNYVSRIKTGRAIGSEEVRNGIAGYFGLTYDQACAEGESIRKGTPPIDDGTKTDVYSQADHNGILQTLDKIFKRHERTKEELARQRGVLEAIGDAVCIISSDLRISYQNQSHRNLVGGNYKNRDCSDVFKEKGFCDCQDKNSPVIKVLTDGMVHSDRIDRPGGLTLDVTSSPIKDIDGAVIAVIQVLRNITARVNAEKHHADFEQAFLLFMADFKSCAIIVDKDFTIEYQNSRHIEKMGEHVGKKCYESIWGKDAPCDDCQAARAMISGVPEKGDKTVTLKTGETVEATVTAIPIKDKLGNVVKCVEAIRPWAKR